MSTSPSTDFPYESKFVEVLGSNVHYVDEGSGPPILFIHGNPTSSYLWRNVIPHVRTDRRAIALDLVGMGKSDKPDIAYRFWDHLEHLEGFIDALGLRDLTLVVHDWGGGLGLSYARRHPHNVRAIAFMECVLLPMEWGDADPVTRFVFRRMRHPEKGRRMNEEKAFFLDRLMPMMTRGRLDPAARRVYAEPYPTPASRRPVAQWPREIPISGEPADMAAEIGANYEWFRSAEIPKLFLDARPGVIFKHDLVEQIEREVAGLTSIDIGKGKHYLPEESPERIGVELAQWLNARVTAG